MDKKVLVSILAMTSAPSLTAWADANLDNLKTGAISDWGITDPNSNITLGQDGLIISPDGVSISRSITLAPGTYTLSAATMTNATILVDDAEPKNGQFVVTGDAVKNVKVTLKATQAQTQFQVGGLELILVYDFNTNRATLETMLSAAVNKIFGDDEAARALKDKSATIAEKLARLDNNNKVDTETGKNDAYEAYVEYKMWLGATGCTLATDDIADFNKAVDAQASNTSAYDKAMALANQQQASLDAFKNILANYEDNETLAKGTFDYATKVSATKLKAAQDFIDAYKTKAEEAYKAGEAGSVMTDEVNKAFTDDTTDKDGNVTSKGATTLVNEFGTAVTAAPDDHKAYLEIITRATALKQQEEAALQAIYKVLSDKDANGEEVYIDTRNEAQAELNEVLMDLNKIEGQNGNENNHEGSAALYEEKQDDLKIGGTFETRIQTLQNKWTQYASENKAAYADAKGKVQALQTQLDELTKIQAIKDKWAESTTAIQKQIDDLKDKIEKDNRAHKFADDAYAADCGEVTTALDKLNTDAKFDIDNYTAHEAAAKAVADAQKELTKAIKAVSELKGEGDIEYSSAGKYTQTETDLQKELDDISTWIENNFKGLGKDGKPVMVDGKEVPQTCDGVDYGIEKFISEKVNVYQTDAETARDNYVETKKTLAEYDASLKKLTDKVTDREVWVGESSSDTYGKHINAIQGKIDAIKKTFNDAIATTDNKYNIGLQNAKNQLADGSDIVEEVDALIGTYDADKEKYDRDIVDQAINNVLQEAARLINATREKLDNISIEALGLRRDDIEGRKRDIGADIDKQEKAVEDAKTTDNKSQALAALTNIKTALEKIDLNIEALIGDVNTIAGEVKANNDKYDELTKVQTGTLAVIQADIDKILDTYKDDERTDEFENKKEALQDVFDALNQDVLTSYDAETLIKDLDDVIKDGKIEKEGYTTRINKLTNNVRTAIDEATACAKNRKAWDDAKAEYDKAAIATAIATAKSNIAKEENGGNYADAKVHYNGVLDGYTKDNETISTDIQKAYEERKSAAQEEALKARIAELLGKVNAVAGEAKNNKVAYEALCTSYSTISDYWTKVYTHIYNDDESSLQKEYVAELTAIKTDLTTTKTLIDEQFNNGKYGSDKSLQAKNQETLNTFDTRIKNLENAQKAGYDELIAKDNQNRHQKFLKALTEARLDFTKAVDIIGQYSSLRNEELRNVAEGEVREANTALNEILTKLNDIQTEEGLKFHEIEAPALFDKEESYKKNVEAQGQAILNALNTLDDAVSGKARVLYSDAINTAEQACETALASIKGITNEEKEADVLKAAQDYNSAADIVKKAKEAQIGKNFALVADAQMLELEKVDGLLASGKEQAATKEWSLCYDAAYAAKGKEEADLDKFEYISGVTRDFKSEYATAWKGSKDGTNKLTELNSLATDYKSKNELFANVVSLKGNLNSAATAATAIYEAAKEASGDNTKNVEAHDKLVAEVAKLQEALNAAKTYTEAYAVTYRVAVYVTTQQQKIDRINEDLEHCLQYGGCTTYKIEDHINKTDIESIYGAASKDELNWLVVQAQGLDGDYVKAYAANADAATPYEEQKDKLQESINKYVIDDKKSNEEIQEALLAFETQIYTLRSELAQIYNAELEATTYAALNESLAQIRTIYETVKSQLDVCREAAKEMHGKQLEAVGTSIENIQNNIEAYNKEAGKLLLCQVELENAISNIDKELAALKKLVDVEYARYTTNKAAYEKLSAELTGYTSNLAETEATIKDFTKVEKEDAADDIEIINKAIEECRKELDASNKQMNLTADSKLTDFTSEDFSANIAALLKRYTHLENQGLISDLKKSINAVQETLTTTGHVMDKESLTEEAKALKEQADNLSTYNDAANTGKISADIDGNEFKEPKDIDYMKEAAQTISNRLNTLKQALRTLNQSIEDNTYIPGDADGDGYVQATDYMQIIKYVLGMDKLPEENTVEFLAADANGDGRINSGDIVNVVNNILGIRTVDALERVMTTNSMESTGEMQMTLVEGQAGKRLAIRLNSANLYVACQMDVKVPEGVTVMGESIEGMGEHSLYTAKHADGTLSLVISSLENAVIDTKGNATIYLDVEGNGAESITVSNVTAADAAGATYSILGKNEATGIDGVNSTNNSSMGLKERVYSVGGQMMDSLKKGINIIRNSDGTARKILKK